MEKEKLIMTERERAIILKLLIAWFEDYEEHEQCNRNGKYHSVIYSHEKMDEALREIFKFDKTRWDALTLEARYRVDSPELFERYKTWDKVLSETSWG